jgi:hypothetical protein
MGWRRAAGLAPRKSPVCRGGTPAFGLPPLAPQRVESALSSKRGGPEPWSLTSLHEKLIKIGAKVASHGRYVTFQMAEVAVPQKRFQEILSLIARLLSPPAPA